MVLDLISQLLILVMLSFTVLNLAVPGTTLLASACAAGAWCWVSQTNQTYRIAFDRPKASIGRQSERIADSEVWVLPNPSGLNAHYQADDLAKLFSEARQAVENE